MPLILWLKPSSGLYLVANGSEPVCLRFLPSDCERTVEVA